MLGGGNFVRQDKVLPGCYINFVSAAAAKSILGERGCAAVPMVLDWGPEKEAFVLKAEDFKNYSRQLLGHNVQDEEMKPFRELFRNLTKAVVYRLNTGVKAANDVAEARYGGSRGNALTLVIAKNADDETRYDVKTLLAGEEVDRQTVSNPQTLKNNDYIVFKEAETLTETAGLPLTGGTDGAAVTGEDYAAFLNAMEAWTFQILCCPAAEEAVKASFAAYTKRMREEAGVKFQTVMYRYTQADHEGIICVENRASDQLRADGKAAAVKIGDTGLVYWVSGAEASCALNRSNENRKYDGELAVDTAYTQKQLSDGVQSGKFLFHKCGDEVHVLMDVNSLTSYTAEKGEDFGNNQTVRVLDQIGNDIASLFATRYLGIVPNDDAGRTTLWNDVVTYNKELVKMRAIEAFETKDITIEAGESKRSVVINCPVTPVNCMSQLYMTIVVR